MSTDTLAPTTITTNPVTVADLDPADHETNETIIYGCGTHAPGLVFEPCQHSTLYVYCCTCAGCMMDVWSCGKEPEWDSWLWYSAHRIGARFDPWVRHPAALMLYALVVIFLLSSQILQDVLYILFVIAVLEVAFVVFALTQLLH